MVKHWVCPNEAELQCTTSSTVIFKAENRCQKVWEITGHGGYTG